MAKKLKNKKDQTGFSLSRRGREKVQALCRALDRAVLGLILLFLVVALLVQGHPYDLGSANPHGFLYCFLLLPAYLPLEIAGAVCWCLGYHPEGICGREVWFLTGADLFCVVLLWGWLRFFEVRHRGPEYFRVALHAARLLLFWGLFQLFCFVMITVWQHGGFTSLHRHWEPRTAVTASPAK